MTGLRLEGLLHRAADPAVALAAFAARGARIVEPAQDHGFMVAGRAEIDGLALEVARFGPAPGAVEAAALLLTVDAADDLLPTARALGFRASAPLHTALGGPDGRPIAWWSVALAGAFDGEPGFPTGVGGLGTALIQTVLGTGAGRRLFAARARGPVILLRAHETRRPIAGSGRVRVRVPGSRHRLWQGLVAALGADGARLIVETGPFAMSWESVGSGGGT